MIKKRQKRMACILSAACLLSASVVSMDVYAAGPASEPELEGLFEEKINSYYQMTEFYEAEEMQNAA